MPLSRIKLRSNFSRFKRKHKKIRFFINEPDAKEIFLVGDFNTWDPKSLPMRKNKDDSWDITVSLCSGRYEYKFIADGDWIIDPMNTNTVSTELGTTNSVITITI